MTREELICLAEDINEWLESMSKKYGLDKDYIQYLLRQFLN